MTLQQIFSQISNSPKKKIFLLLGVGAVVIGSYLAGNYNIFSRNQQKQYPTIIVGKLEEKIKCSGEPNQRLIRVETPGEVLEDVLRYTKDLQSGEYTGEIKKFQGWRIDESGNCVPK